MAELELKEALRRLGVLATMDWVMADHAADGAQYGALAEAVESLGASANSKSVRPSRLERAQASWDRHLASGGVVNRSDLMTLCWEPSVASTSEFCRTLGAAVPLRCRAVRGLMNSYHELWPPPTEDLELLLRLSLRTMDRARDPVESWMPLVKQLVGATSPSEFADGCLEDRLSVSSRLESLGLSPTTEFARSSAWELGLAATEPDEAPAHVDYLLTTFFGEDNALLEPREWGQIYARLVLNDRLLAGDLERQRLIDLALQVRGLGDPRLHIRAWENVPPAARDRVMQWLSEEDLRFFFDMIMEGQADPQGRYAFWIDYAGRALRSRVVVGTKDQSRLAAKLDEIRRRGRTYARMRGATTVNSHVSAFIMDFGEVVVVEFSQRNSACYIYRNDPRNPYFDLLQQGFAWSQLKNTRAAHRWMSHGYGWQDRFRSTLAGYGIRPE